MAISDGHGLPLAIHVASASPHEVTLVDATLAAAFLDPLPTLLIGHRGYDSDRLDRHLRETYGIETIASIARIVAPALKTADRFAARCAAEDERVSALSRNYRRISRAVRHPVTSCGLIHLASALPPGHYRSL